MTVIWRALDAGEELTLPLNRLEGRTAIFDCVCGSEVSVDKYRSVDRVVLCEPCRRPEYQLEAQVFRRIKRDAKTRGLDFVISVELFASMAHLPCTYCGGVDRNAAKVYDSNLKQNVVFRYNGIDRLDNSVGYVDDNCVPCCVVCNRAKREMNHTDFMDWINQLMNWHIAGGTR